jgi:hypothetical protein
MAGTDSAMTQVVESKEIVMPGLRVSAFARPEDKLFVPGIHGAPLQLGVH